MPLPTKRGGVGKTTTAVNLAACVAAVGKKVLLVDLDPQGNTTSGYGVNKRAVNTSVYEVLTGEAKLSEALVHTKYHVDVVPQIFSFPGASIELVSLERREFRLRDALGEVVAQYDFIFIDCPPSLDLLTINGLCACDTVLVPIQCEFFALEGLTELMNSIRKVKKLYNPYIDIEGVLLTMFDGRLNSEIARWCRKSKNTSATKCIKPQFPATCVFRRRPATGCP